MPPHAGPSPSCPHVSPSIRRSPCTLVDTGDGGQADPPGAGAARGAARTLGQSDAGNGLASFSGILVPFTASVP